MNLCRSHNRNIETLQKTNWDTLQNKNLNTSHNTKSRSSFSPPFKMASQEAPLSLETKRARMQTRHVIAKKYLSMKNGNTHKEKYGMMKKFVTYEKKSLPWLEEKMVKFDTYRMRKRMLKNATEQRLNTQPSLETKHSKKIGRPIGTTNNAKANIEKKKSDAKIELTNRIKCARAAQCNYYLPKGTFQNIHDEVLKEFGLLESSFKINKNTINFRIREGVFRVKPGPLSPVPLELEHILLSFVKYRQDCCQPMTKIETIELNETNIVVVAMNGNIVLI